ncbi:hypothetical protein ABFZ85_12240 [Hyphococcus formosus]|uniref:hypothetical protein n=1 Tax=Hyphococcus formosus TaxID=3143534 RepID=UPI00398B449D
MVDFEHRKEGDRIVITLDPGQPVELGDLSESFAALARIYERHYRPDKEDHAPKLYVTKLETGSYIMEIAPLAVFMGAVTVMDGGIIVADFTNRIWRGIKSFSGFTDKATMLEMPSNQDAEDIKEFAKPLLGKGGARLGIQHARYEKTDGEKSTVVEYTFDETELNRAAINIDKALELPTLMVPKPEPGKTYHEVMLFLEQANRAPGKQSGRTGDKGVIPDISENALPVYFRKGIQELKEQMVLSEANPLEMTFVVDVYTTVLNGEVKGYTVLEIHDSFPRED